MSYQDKKAAVIGLGVSNTPLIKYLAKHGAVISVFDQKSADQLEQYIGQLSGLNLTYRLGEGYLQYLTDFDYIFVTPGMRKDIPELVAAKKRGAVFSSEMEVFLQNAPGIKIGITGSSGKTTTTTLVGEMIKAHYPSVYIGGNIGRSLIEELPLMNDTTRIVLELSSFQLQDLKQSPDIAVITNITPNHLDMHASMDEYIQAKCNILRFQNEDQLAILNYDNEITRDLAQYVKGKLFYFSRMVEHDTGAFLKGDRLVLRLDGNEETITVRNHLKLLGDHNVENILTAALTARLAGVPINKITKIVEGFTGVEHRLELVREWNGINFYNDSISTTPDRAIAGLKAMTRPTVLIAGGYDKKLPFDQMGEQIVKTCKALVVLGVTAPQIIAAVKKVSPDFPVQKADSFEAAVLAATKIAASGDVVLLSPACASYDMFNNYQERGREFKRIVNEL